MDNETRVGGERRRRGVTAAALAQELEITREAVGLIERGKIEISDHYADRMVEAIEKIAVEVGAGK